MRVHKFIVNQLIALLAIVCPLGSKVALFFPFYMATAIALLSEPLQIVEVVMMSPLLSEPPSQASNAAALLPHCVAAVLGFDLRRHASIYSSSA